MSYLISKTNKNKIKFLDIKELYYSLKERYEDRETLTFDDSEALEIVVMASDETWKKFFREVREFRIIDFFEQIQRVDRKEVKFFNFEKVCERLLKIKKNPTICFNQWMQDFLFNK